MNARARGALFLVIGTVLAVALVYVKLQLDTVDAVVTIATVAVISLVIHTALEDLT